ncbi:MAG TPA: DUF2269 family protein [Solirubrobacteraceae bacterium]|nr:DUF2269 family protein [Solirubrobacteraceae bacterium]
MLIAAVSLTSVALAVHVAAVVVAFGPLFAYPALLAAVRRADPSALPAVYRAQHLVARRLITPALPVTLIAGLYLAAQEHAFGHVWVVVPLVVLVLLMALHRFVLIRGYRRLARPGAEGEGAAPGDEVAARVTHAELLAAALVLVTIYVMAARPF